MWNFNVDPCRNARALGGSNILHQGTSGDEPITIEMTQADQIIVTMVATIGGAILLFLLPKGAVWALANLPWVPWDGPLKLLIAGEQMVTRWGVARSAECLAS